MFTLLALLLFIPSQIFWLWQIRAFGRRYIRADFVRNALGWTGLAIYFGVLAFNLWWSRAAIADPAHLTLEAALLQAPFRWWMLSSLVGFTFMGVVYLPARAAYGLAQKLIPGVGSGSRALVSPARRHFLTKAAVAISATPFAACAYGLLDERTDIEIAQRPILLSRLPKAFDGFRIAQVSDIHIGPFMPVEDIHRCVRLVKGLKPDLIALTGDFVTWTGSPELAVVEALSGLKAPFGVWGCLGNHEIWAHVEDSITRLFAQRGTRILRQQNVAIETSGERINLIGVDYQSRRHFGPLRDGLVPEYLQGVDSLMAPDAVNILLSHNPNTFDRAAQLGIDLSLAGHTHGGQVALEFISPDISPARLITAYVRGWFKKGNSQLYVNRGIGTIFSPVRFGSPPEITVYELKRS
jgi:uncharacterized protein